MPQKVDCHWWHTPSQPKGHQNMEEQRRANNTHTHVVLAHSVHLCCVNRSSLLKIPTVLRPNSFPALMILTAISPRLAAMILSKGILKLVPSPADCVDSSERRTLFPRRRDVSSAGCRRNMRPRRANRNPERICMFFDLDSRHYYYFLLSLQVTRTASQSVLLECVDFSDCSRQHLPLWFRALLWATRSILSSSWLSRGCCLLLRKMVCSDQARVMKKTRTNENVRERSSREFWI